MGKRRADGTSFENMFAVEPEDLETEVKDNAEEASFISTEESITLISEGIDKLDEKSAVKKAAAKELPEDMIIPVKSLVFGELIFRSKESPLRISWRDIGEVKEMTMKQIIEMNNSSSDYLFKPYVVLLNADAAEYFGLSEIYKNLASIWNLMELFKKPETVIIKTIETALSVNLRDVLIAQVRKMYGNRTLTDVRIIKILEKKLQIDLLES